MQMVSSLTSDGTRLAFSELTPDGGAEIRTVPVESGSGQMRAGEPQFFVKTSSAQPSAAFSPDGRWLAYGNAEGGTYDVHVRPFPDQAAQSPISIAGAAIHAFP